MAQRTKQELLASIDHWMQFLADPDFARSQGLTVQQVFDIVNTERAQVGLPSLVDLYRPHLTIHPAQNLNARRHGEVEEQPLSDAEAVSALLQGQGVQPVAVTDAAAVAQIMAPPGPPPPPAPAPSGRDRVKALQQKLNGMGARLSVDGVMGPKTKAAMQQFGLDENGNPVSAPAPQPAGGGQGGDGQGGGPVTTVTAASATPKPNLGSVEDQIRRNFGFMAWALDDPEIGPLLRQGITEGWDLPTLQGRLEQTNVWKTTSAAQRDWRRIKATDPAQAEARIGQTLDQVNNMAASAGIQITPERARQIAEQFQSDGWSPLQLQNAVGSEFHYTPGAQKGTIGKAEDTIKQIAASYLVPLSDSTLADWERQIAQGTAADPEVFRQYIVDQAKGLFPTLAKQLDAGLTVQQLAEPYRQIAAGELDITPESIDFTQPKWNKALNTPTDPKTGERGMMGLYDWQRTIRSDDAYGWRYTKKANDTMFGFENSLLQALGKVPGAR